MADLLYPVDLPGPAAWRQNRIERRQMRDLREPADANRLRSRELGLNVDAEWAYEAAQMAAWKAWFEGALATQAARLRYFTAPLPGRGGILPRVARYMAAPQRVYVGGGIWRITAPLYVRGLSVSPQQSATAAGDPAGTELREDLGRELREDNSAELRG
jgi:hypothetical protein